jgi:hypothetical protein
MKRQGVAPDGACLFNAVDYLVTGEFHANTAEQLRNLCAETILADTNVYNVVYLGQDPVAYAAWIREMHNYGGEVEILILCSHFNCRISVVSMESLSVLTYSPAEAANSEVLPNIYILYNGQHYDALISQAGQRIFYDKALDDAAIAFAREEKRARDIMLRTRIRKKLRCICGAVVDNTAEFQAHCEQVEHGEDFGYECEEVEVKEMVENEGDD